MIGWLWLLACPAQPVDTEVSGDTETSPDLTDATLGEASDCVTGTPAADPHVADPTGVTAAPPIPAGLSSEVALGPLEDTGLIVRTPVTGAVDYDWDLDEETFEVFLPEDYDASEPLGLLVHIDAGNTGRPPEQWLDALQAEHVLWLGANGVGNPEDVSRRMGLSVLGAARVQELFNIDRGRIWSTGTSGGGRTGTMAALLHPELFAGAMPLCGSAYVAEVDQDYETQEPDGHYEYWGDDFFPDIDGEAYGDWLLGFGQRFALLTSFDDFRQGDLFNIYHNGYEPGGWQARLLEGEGGHCATSAEQAFDALAFLQHPHHDVTPTRWLPLGDVASGDGTLSLTGEATAVGDARLFWEDAQGAVLRLDLTPASDGTAQLGLVGFDEALALDALHTPDPDVPGIWVTLAKDQVSLLATGGGSTSTLYAGQLADGEDPTSVVMKLSVWASELQLDLGLHHDPDAATLLDPAVLLLDDARTVRVRLDQWSHTHWAAGDLASGAVLVLSTAGDGAGLEVNAVEVLDATGFACEGG